MPLSEEEQRLLEQMEQALAADDPKFASTLRGSALAARSRRQALIAAVVFVLGIAVLMIGAVIQLTLVAVAGFVVMLSSAYFFAMAWRRAQAGESEAAKPTAPGGATVHNLRTKQKQKQSDTGSFMDRMEERWRRRRDDQDGY